MKFKLILLLALSALFHSCSKCEKSQQIGEFPLTESSKSFVPYTGTETLVFVDQDGTEHSLTCRDGRDLQASRMTVRTLCDEGFLDREDLFFATEREQTEWFDSFGRQIFYTDMMTFFEDTDDLDSIAVYDFLNIFGTVDGSSIGSIAILTEERQNQVSDTHRREFINHSRLIGDTILFDRSFTDVFVASHSNGNKTYYNSEKGVVAFQLPENKFWVLKD